jgi:tape measure domain-containing protein
MSTVSHFNIKVAVDSKTGQAELVKFGKVGKDEMEKLKKSADGAKGSFLSFSNLLKGAGVAAVGMLGASMVKGAASLETYGVQFEVLTGSAEKGKKLFDEIRAAGAATPFTTDELAGVTTKMMAMGSAAEDVVAQTLKLGDISMGNAQKLETLSNAFGKIQMNGRLMGEELNMMIDAGFNPLESISKKTGKSMVDLRKDMEKGAISFDMVKESIAEATGEGGKFEGMMQKQSQTFMGMLSTLQDTIGMLMAEAGQPLLQLLKELMPVITPIVQSLGDALRPVIEQVAKTVQALLPHLKVLLDGIFKALAPVLNVVVSSMGKLTPIFEKLVIAAAKIVEAMAPMLDVFAELVEEQLDQMVDLVSALLDLFIALTPAITLVSQVTASIIKTGLSFMNTVVTPLITAIEFILKKGAEAANWVASIFGGKKTQKQKQEEKKQQQQPPTDPAEPPATTLTPTTAGKEKLVPGSAPYMEAQIKALEKLRDKTVQGSDAWAKYTLQIAAMQAEMDVFKRIAEDLASGGIKGKGVSVFEKIAEDIALIPEATKPAIDATVSLLDELALSFEAVASAVSSTLGSLAELFNSNFEEMKAVSLAQAIIDTSAGVAKALGQGGWLGIAGAVSVGLAGAAQIKKIIETRPGSGASGGGPAPVQSGSAPAGQRLAPQRLNITGASQKIELSGTLVAKGGDLVYVMNQQTRIGERAGV